MKQTSLIIIQNRNTQQFIISLKPRCFSINVNKKLKDEHESALFDARKARDSVVDKNEEFKAALEKRDEIISVMKKNTEESERKELQTESTIRNLESEVATLKAKLETVQQNYDRLTDWKAVTEQQEQKV